MSDISGAFDLLDVGESGQVELLSKRDNIRGDLHSARQLIFNSTTPVGVLPKRSTQEIYDYIEKQYLHPKPAFPRSWLEQCQEIWPKNPDLNTVLSLEPSSRRTRLAFKRDNLSHKIIGFEEIELQESLSAKNSTSMYRPVEDQSDYVRGRSTNLPFTPGGIDMTATRMLIDSKQGEGLDEIPEIDFDDESKFSTTPDGFDHGLLFDEAGGVAGNMPPISLDYESGQIVSQDASAEADEHFEITSDYDGSPMLSEEAERGPSEAVTGADSDIDGIVLDSQELLDLGMAKAEPSDGQKKSWAHMVDISGGFPDFHKLVPDMAMKYKFELDIFQKEAIYHLERGDSVFVAAHTSAGKTVVAEYAIALSKLHMTKTIYTSPIKALSNQKFRDFCNTYGEDQVGILTGDVQIRPEAPCLVMTTEILRSMLYRGADLLRDVEFVVFDEVHYVNDIERGMVWEEVIIMLPQHVSLILLSATVPNTYEFAEWVGNTKKRDIYVISTLKRPVPLEHFLYVPNPSKPSEKQLHKIVDASGNFNITAWKKAHDIANKEETAVTATKAPSVAETKRGRGGADSAADQRGPGRGSGGAGRGSARTSAAISRELRPKGSGKSQGGRGTNFWVHLVGYLRKEDLLPAVVFTFSRKKCEEFASTLSNVDFMNSSLKSEMHVFIERSLKRLKPEDRELPQITRMRELLKRGIGVHHSGLLPIIKEIVEILFGRGLIKVLFATETFAMGVNMPARCVVFSSLRKHDGREFRNLLPGEYTQMSGRAGRRGIDSTGMVIIACDRDSFPNTSTLNEMILGTPTKLNSQFRLTYTMILNLLRVKQFRVEEMIKRSFLEHASQQQLPGQMTLMQKARATLDGMESVKCEICDKDLLEFYQAAKRIQKINNIIYDKASTVIRGAASANFRMNFNRLFERGRVVVLNDFDVGPRLAVLNFPGTHGGGGSVASLDSAASTKQLKCLVLQPQILATKSSSEPPRRGGSDNKAEGQQQRQDQPAAPPPPYPLTNLADFARKTLKHMSKCIITPESVNLSSVAYLMNKTIHINFDPGTRAKPQRSDLVKLKPEFVQVLLDMSKERISEYSWNKIKAFEFQSLWRERGALIKSVDQHQCLACPSLKAHYEATHKRQFLEEQLEQLKDIMSDQSLLLIPDYNLRIDVLRSLKCIGDDNTVQLKGRVACEINSGDELVLTELVFNNVLSQYEPEEIVALLSCFVCKEKNEPPWLKERLPPQLLTGQQQFIEEALRVAHIQRERGIDIAPEDHVAETMRFGMMEVCYEWARGMSFNRITDLTDVQEGMIVRSIVQLDEVLREVKTAAKIVGDASLAEKMDVASSLIKRDIVFAASLYF